MIRSATGNQTFERHKWSSQNGIVQAWINDIVWKCIEGPKNRPSAPNLKDVPAEAFETCRQVILHHGLEGMAHLVFGDGLLPALGKPFYDAIETSKQRTELYLQEVHWLLGPKLGPHIILLGDFAMRQQYSSFADSAFNPRFIQMLQLWTPTLGTREEVIALLCDGGFHPDPQHPNEYIFRKITDGVPHSIRLMGTMWEAAKNWTLDLERAVWDRSLQYSSSFPLRIEPTDLFLVACRRFSIDTLAGGVMALIDLVTMLEQSGDNVDWDRLRAIKNMFHRPDWLWSALLGVELYERKTGRLVALPDWAREGVKDADSFLVEFVASRFNWACPDLRLIDYPRAWVKVAKGT